MPIPSTPITNSGLKTPLLTTAQYETLTGDSSSTEAQVAQAITAAITMLQLETCRTFGYGRYREDLYLYKMGMVWPSATPIDRTKAIAAGVNYTQTGQNLYTPTNPATQKSTPASIIQGTGIWVGWFTPLPWMPVWTGVIPPQTVISYWGGWQPYQATPKTTISMPAKMARLIARVAYYSLHPTMVSPVGATSTGAGGISLGGELSSMMIADPQLRRDIKRWRRAQAHAWDQ